MFIDAGCPPMTLRAPREGGYSWGVRAQVYGKPSEELHGGYANRETAQEMARLLAANVEYQYAVVVRIETPEQR